MGVPVVVGEEGMERVIELPLVEDEAAAFRQSAAQVRADIGRLK
jgi:malate/lactate dehydrogenase